MNKLKVLVVDDSPTTRELMTSIINGAPDMAVIGQAFDGRRAVKMAVDLRPDVIAMDVVMPEMDGLDATREIMHVAPTPIVLVSASLDTFETDIAFEAIQRGALAVHQKPGAPGSSGYEAEVSNLLRTLRAMAGVHVIHHWQRGNGARPAAAASKPAPPTLQPPVRSPEVVALVTSTGGPAALGAVLGRLPADFHLPVVIAQHIAPDFVAPLAEWLDEVSPLRVRVAEQGGCPLPGHAHIAPADAHLQMVGNGRFDLDRNQGGAAYMPSADILLGSVAQVYQARAVGVVMTGMGTDGALGLLAMRQAGAITIAQDEASSVVFGMPREAAALGAAGRVLSLIEIAGVLTHLAYAAKKETPT